MSINISNKFLQTKKMNEKMPKNNSCSELRIKFLFAKRIQWGWYELFPKGSPSYTTLELS